MPIRVGSALVDDVRIGDTRATKVYQGGNLVYTFLPYSVVRMDRFTNPAFSGTDAYGLSVKAYVTPAVSGLSVRWRFSWQVCGYNGVEVANTGSTRFTEGCRGLTGGTATLWSFNRGPNVQRFRVRANRSSNNYINDAQLHVRIQLTVTNSLGKVTQEGQDAFGPNQRSS